MPVFRPQLERFRHRQLPARLATDGKPAGGHAEPDPQRDGEANGHAATRRDRDARADRAGDHGATVQHVDRDRRARDAGAGDHSARDN